MVIWEELLLDCNLMGDGLLDDDLHEYALFRIDRCYVNYLSFQIGIIPKIDRCP